MVSSDKKLANVVGGKTARACDSCIKKRARWYCAADDAFLCQFCDGLVHSANPLARRHERVRLKIASLKIENQKPSPPWHQGFTKKPRTPRGRQTPKSDEKTMRFNPLHLVPEIGNDEPAIQTSDEQLLYRVPVFDPFAAEMCFSGNSNSPAATTPGSKSSFDLNSLNGLLLPTDVELAEFAADVESLLGKGLDEESFDMEGLGFLDCGEKVKVEEEVMKSEVIMESENDMMREPFQLCFDYDSPEEDEKVVVDGGGHGGGDCRAVVKEDYYENKRILKLDYEGIIAAWDDQRSPWTTGDRPELDPDECMGGLGIMHHHPCGHMGMMTGNPAMLDGGREARVSRYREKRRTRLFSKKIRYEVRKLNAEKRPRMKGRFVKRTNFATNVSGFPLHSK